MLLSSGEQKEPSETQHQDYMTWKTGALGRMGGTAEGKSVESEDESQTQA